MFKKWRLFSIFAAILFGLTLGQLTYFNTLAQSAPLTAPITSPVVSPTPIPIPAGPKVQLTYPLNGMVVVPGSKVTLQATASSGAGVNRVVFHVNSSHLCTDYTAPYSCNWTVPQASGASYTLTAWIIDNAGKKNSSSVKVTSELPAKRVFITSTTYNGDLGRLTGGDSKCQTQANTANLGGTWKAWLSDKTTSAASRLVHYGGPYQRVDGIRVANNWLDLTDGSLLAPINVTELKTTFNATWVWTGTFADGSIRQADDHGSCASWYSSFVGGTTGDSSRIDSGWSDYGASACYYSRPLFCIEQ